MANKSKKFVVKEATRKRCKIVPFDAEMGRKVRPISLELFGYLREAKGIDFSLFFRNQDELIEFIKPSELSQELLDQMWNASLMDDADVEVCLLKADFPKFEAVVNNVRMAKIRKVMAKDPTLDVTVMEVYATLSAASQLIVRGGVNSNVANRAISATTTIMKQQLHSHVALGTLSRMIECDSTLYDHSASVAMLSSIIASKIIKNPLNIRECEIVGQCGLYHDAGKACVPNHVLNKPGVFTKDEFEVMKTHTVHGHTELLSAIKKGAPIEEIAARVALEHHERFTGKGYPNHRKGRLEENENGIHLYTRIVTIADVYSALLMKRVYKDAMSSNEAIELMAGFADDDFDPDIFRPFYEHIHDSIKLFEKKRKEREDDPGSVKMIGYDESFMEAVKEVNQKKRTG